MLAISILGLTDKSKIIEINKTKVDYIHLDVMDGLFVQNKTKDIDFFSNLLADNKKPIDIHLMVKDVISYVDEYKKFEPDYITFHIEAVSNPVRIIEYIKKQDIKVGISIKPETDLEKIRPYLNLVDLVLVMSVEPGLGGQKFIEKSVDRINKLKEIKDEYNYNYIIEVDGGINNENCRKVNNANMLVVGSYITNTDNYDRQINNILKKKKID